MTGFHIDPAAVRQSSDRLVGVVDRMADAFTRLETDLRAQGSPWGTGLVGSVIGELYEVIHDLALHSYEKNAEIISEYADGLDHLADVITELEDEVTDGFRSIEPRIPGR
jgi:hypothetical protein